MSEAGTQQPGEVNFPEQFNLAHYYLYDRIAEDLADRPAVIYGERHYTYGQIAERSRRLAAWFRGIGIAREQRILIVLPDVPAFIWSFFATLTRGAVVAMGNPAAPTADLAYVLGYSRAAALITLPGVADRLAADLRDQADLKALLLVAETATGEDCEAAVAAPAALQGLGCPVLALAEAVDEARGEDTGTEPATHRDDLAMWLFTSGSTGRAKAAVHSHRDFAFNTEVYAKATVGYRREDRTVSVPRLFFGYATGTNLMFPFAVGATSCLFSESPKPETLARAIAMYRPTVVTNVPTMMSKLLDYDESLVRGSEAGLDFASVRFHLSAGEALPPALLQRFMDRFGGEVYDGIGSAEMFHIYASNRPGDIKPGSLGRPVPGYTVRILPTDAEGPGAAPVGVNETGILWVKGDSVALGYFQDRDKSWQTFHGHWCRTGDLFRMDNDGYLWFSGRADSLFKVGGIWVAPLEVEECLQENPAVALAAVIPAREGELDKPKAFVVLREGIENTLSGPDATDRLREKLQAHVMDRLSKHKYPRWVVFVDDLPRNDRGKVDRRQLIDAEKRGENPWS